MLIFKLNFRTIINPLDQKNLIFVNRPVNAFRMEGNIGGINKVIYLFGDYHVDVTYQTECEIMEAIEMKDYLLKKFRNSEKNNIDFFMEAEPNDISIKMNTNRQKYFISILIQKKTKYIHHHRYQRNKKVLYL